MWLIRVVRHRWVTVETAWKHQGKEREKSPGEESGRRGAHVLLRVHMFSGTLDSNFGHTFSRENVMYQVKTQWEHF